jgi:hypothetical protein
MIKENNLWKTDEKLATIIQQIYHQHNMEGLTGEDMN